MKPVAIIGIGCRFPGASSPDGLWTVARDGASTTSEVPADRWNVDDFYDPDPGTPGKMSSRVGGFVDAIDRFDGAFFGVSPREAAQMDPQQRLLLEVCWEAFENAGLPPADVAGQPVAAFIGLQRNDYGRLMPDVEQFNPYTVAGNQFSMTVSRLSYFYDLRGPCLALDAGCSSVLAAVHLACASLETEESSLALAGGVHLGLAPHDSVAASQAWMLSPGGRCRSFDAAADGYVRSEGCGLFVLKRLEDAVRAGDGILAVIRGTAFLQEGRPGGFTSPWGPEVERTFARALERAGVTGRSLGYVEAHGVGSPVADATEYKAIARVVSAGGERAAPCYVGSIKPNIGHAETAAGAASLIKATYVLRTGVVPPLAGFERLNPDVDDEARTLVVPREAMPFPALVPRRAAVNAFGLGGTNATVVLEEAPPVQAVAAREGVHAMCVSARTPAALAVLAARYRAFLLERADVTVAEATSASVRRASLQHRAVVLGSTLAALCDGLASLAEAAPRRSSNGSLVVGEALPQQPRIALVMRRVRWSDAAVRDLTERCAPFREALRRATVEAGSGPDALTLALGRLWVELGAAPSLVLADEATRAVAEQLAGSAIAVATAPATLSLRAASVAQARGCDVLVDVAGGGSFDARRGEELGAASEGYAGLLRALAGLWVTGTELDLRKLEARVRHVALPTYPFEGQRCWVDELGPGTGLPPAFDRSRRAADEPPAGASSSLQSDDAAERQRAVIDLLRRGVGTALGRPPGEVPVDVALRDLGLASIDLLAMMEQLRRAAGLDLDPARFMDQPSIEEMASRIVFGTGDDLTVVDLSAEGNLDASIDASALPPMAHPPRAVLLTGATGFLGAFLLRELLDRTEATVYCLVRALDGLDGERRLAQNLARYGLSSTGLEDRVRVVVGDLGKPLLGLSYERFDLLGTRLDAVYHAAALVNWAYPYRTLRESNVDGTEEVVRLAAHMRRKAFHHVSTIGVFPLGVPELGVCYERDGLLVPDRSEWLGTGYNQSKWVAEKLLYAAGSRRGLPVSIYRPGFVTGRSDTGATQLGRHDFIAAFMKGCIQFGEAPDWDVALDLMPVDYLARAIVELSRRPSEPGRPMAYNMVNPAPLKYRAVYELLGASGYRLKTVAYLPWRERVLGLAREPGDHALFPFWPYYAGLDADRAAALSRHMGDRLPFDDENVRVGLAGSGLRCPPVRELVPTYAAYFREKGYFPAPPA